MTTPSSAHDDDAQREMQQRSLRNVRALLDKLENEAEAQRLTRRRIAVVLIVTGLVALAGGYLAVKSRGFDSGVVNEITSPRIERAAREPARAP
jgi:hypothetical protein